ncbi:MAG: tripartite tricarboxylate transporter substrate binding protein [Chloroflexota bacterium]
MNSRKNILFVLLLLSTLILSACIDATYPARPITMMVPFRAGGGTDTQGRVLAERMSDTLGQAVNVVNNAGAGGTVGMQELLASDPDGYTMSYAVSVAATVNNQLQELDYDMSDFRMVGVSSTFQSAIVTGGDSPFSTWDEFVAYATENPGLKYMYLGQDNRIMMEAIAGQEGLELEYVPADGGAAIAPALISGDVDIAFSGGIHARFLETGEMQVLLNMNNGPLMATPDAPSSADIYGISSEIQGGLLVPAGTPDEIVATLEAAFKSAVESDEYIEVMANIQFPVTYLSADDAQAEWQKAYDDFAAVNQ